MGEQHELLTALGWAFSGDRQLLPALNVSLRTSLSHPGSVPQRGGKQVGQTPQCRIHPNAPMGLKKPPSLRQ